MFGMYHVIVDLNKDCFNYAPWAKRGPFNGLTWLPLEIYRDILKKTFSLKSPAPEFRHFACVTC